MARPRSGIRGLVPSCCGCRLEGSGPIATCSISPTAALGGRDSQVQYMPLYDTIRRGGTSHSQDPGSRYGLHGPWP